VPLAAGVLLSAVAATLAAIIPTLSEIEEPWNIVVVSQVLTLARITFVTALAHAVVLGLPLYFLLRRNNRSNFIACAIGGFAVGAGPFAILDLTSMILVQHASSGGKETILNGVPTLAGWIEYGSDVGVAGLIGVAGGFSFYVALRSFGPLGGASNETAFRSKGLNVRQWSIFATTVLLVGAMVILPGLAKDDSCHNIFRNGRTSATPEIYADIEIAVDDWPALRKIFSDFGASHSLLFREDKAIRDGKPQWLDLNLCNEAGINIDAVADRGNPSVELREIDVSIYFYELGSNANWKLLAPELFEKIIKRWPQETTFHRSDGRFESVDQAIKDRP
jgi:hypothetical protein